MLGLSRSDLDRFLRGEEAEQAIGHIANNLFAGHPNLVEGIRQLELYSLCRLPLSSLRAAACTFLSRTMSLTTYLANSIVDLTKGAIRSKIKQRGRDAAPRYQRATRW